jgi:type VI secretion system protein VasG
MKGEFENRLRQVIEEVQSSPSRSFCSSTRHIRLLELAARRDGRRRQSAQTRPGPRHATHGRGDHLGRIQEAYRKGSSTDAKISSDPSRRAERGEGDSDDARNGQHAGTASSRTNPRRSFGSFRPALPPLHSRLANFPTNRSACSIRPARVSPSASTRCPAEVDDCRRTDRSFGNGTGDYRSRKSRRRRHGKSARRPPREIERERTRLEALESRWSRSGRLVEEVLTIRSRLRGVADKVEGTGSQVGTSRRGSRLDTATSTSAAELSTADASCDRSRRNSKRCGANGLLGRLAGVAGRAGSTAGRNAPDPADRGRTGRRRGRRGLDRHPRRQDGQE